MVGLRGARSWRRHAGAFGASDAAHVPKLIHESFNCGFGTILTCAVELTVRGVAVAPVPLRGCRRQGVDR